MTHPVKPNDEFTAFVESLREELVAMSDEDVLDGVDVQALQTRRERIFAAAKKEAGIRRLALAKGRLAASRSQPASPTQERIDPAEARRYIAAVANDERYTMAARQLGPGLTDEEAVRLYQQIRALESRSKDSGESS